MKAARWVSFAVFVPALVLLLAYLASIGLSMYYGAVESSILRSRWVAEAFDPDTSTLHLSVELDRDAPIVVKELVVDALLGEERVGSASLREWRMTQRSQVNMAVSRTLDASALTSLCLRLHSFSLGAVAFQLNRDVPTLTFELG